MWPTGNPVDDVLFWAGAVGAFWLVYRLWPYIKMLLGFALFAVIVGTIFARGYSGGTTDTLPPTGEVAQRARDALLASRAWDACASFATTVGVENLDEYIGLTEPDAPADDPWDFRAIVRPLRRLVE